MKEHSTLTAIAVLAGAGLFLAACAVDESIDREASVQLEPMAILPVPGVGEEFHGLQKGEPETTKVVAMDGDTITLTNTEGPDKGCIWTRKTGSDRFSPSVSWENCGGTGTQKYTKSGNIWPLTVGNSESYDVTGKDQKNSWNDTRKCEVKAAVMVSLQDKQYPTYEIVCSDNWSIRSWYVSPELQRSIKYKRVHKRRGVVSDWVAVLQ